jgi:hypothetical protein
LGGCLVGWQSPHPLEEVPFLSIFFVTACV